MGKNRNKHRNLVPNIYRLRIEEVMYIVDDKHIKCIIKYVNPITLNLQTSIGAANCNPNDTFDVSVGKHLAESRAKYNMYRGYKKYIDVLLSDVFTKYDKLLEIESKHIQDIINEL